MAVQPRNLYWYIVVAFAAGFTIGMIFGSLINPGGDMDGDGVIDRKDNCPFIPNPDQEDINPQNNIGDVCDKIFEEFGVSLEKLDLDGDGLEESGQEDPCPWNVKNDCRD